MSKSTLDNLEIYNNANQIAKSIWEIVVNWNTFSKSTLGNQLCRTIDSVGANIAEGYGRGSKKDNSRFIKIARGSLFEAKHWVSISFDRNLISDKIYNDLISKIENRIPRASAFRNYLDK